MKVTHATTTEPDSERALVFRGTPDDLAQLVWARNDPHTGVGTNDYGVYIGGLEVTKVNMEAQHNGKPAYGFTLTDRDGRRDVGRLVLLDSDEWFDDQPEWTVVYEDEAEALENLAIFTARDKRPEVSTVTLDMAFEDPGGSEAAAAMVAAEHGVSVTILNEAGPGGGWPEVRVSGLTKNVEKALRSDYYGWSMDADDVKELLG